MFAKSHGIILALDVPTLDEAKSLAKLSLEFNEIVGYKIGFILGLRYGLKKVTAVLKDVNPLPVIYDHQKAGTDIPQMGEPFASSCKEANIDGVIIFPQAGPNTLDSFVSSIFKHEMTPIVGGVMTHSGYSVSEGGYIIDDAPKNIFQASIDAGVTHFVLPGNKTELIREYNSILNQKHGTSVMMPGIGSQGGDLKTAFSACAGLNPYAIIGSAIYKSDNPSAATETFVNTLNEYLTT